MPIPRSTASGDLNLPLPNDRPKRVGQAAIGYAPTSGILTRTSGFLSSYDYSLNPYSGCAFGCSYCYAAFFAPEKALADSWGTWVTVKENAAEQIRRLRTSLDGKRIYMSSVTDPYQPVERVLGLTRKILEALAARHRPILVVQTRSPDVVRDIDLYLRIVSRGGAVQVNMTVTTDDDDIRESFEPLCPSTTRRLRAIGEVNRSGIETCVTLTPLLRVRAPEEFAKRLIATGARRFVSQAFELRNGRFVAGTRKPALKLMARKLDCTPADLPTLYLSHYRQAVSALRRHLPGLEEGKQGFAPPAVA